MDYACSKLGVKEGEITSDGLFQVVGVECLGACGYAPMMQLGDFYKEHLNEEKIDQLIADCKENKITLHDK
jgi:NADH-quinone oxidoreductase subunit E